MESVVLGERLLLCRGVVVLIGFSSSNGNFIDWAGVVYLRRVVLEP